MDPFSITCTTCQSRLRVQDEAAIGQILACPKCGSMVHVAQPDIPSAGATRPESTPSVPASTPDAPPVDTPRKPRFREDFPPPSTAQASPEPENSPTTATEAANETVGDTTPGESNEALPADAPGGLGQWMPIMIAAVVGVALAIGVVSLLISRKAQQNPPSSESPPIVGKLSPSSALPAVDKADKPGHEPGPADSTAEVKTPDDSTADAGETHPDQAGTSPTTSDGPPGATPKSEGLAKPGDAQNDAPPGMVPRAPAASDATGATRSGSTPAMVHASSDSSSRVTAEPDSTPPTEITPPQLDVTAQLSVAIASIEFEHLALADFARFISDFTTIPVTLDVHALQALGLTADSELEFQLHGVTVEQLLRKALAPVGLTFTHDAGQLVITSPEFSNGDLRTVTYDIADLVADPEQLGLLGRQIVALVEPGSWEAAGGRGSLEAGESTLEIRQSESVQFHIARFLDQLRSARGLLARSDLPREVIDPTPPAHKIAKALAAVVSTNFARPTPVKRILDYLRVESDVRLLVDWRATSQVGWTMGTESTLVATGEPLGKQLENWLTLQRLNYRAVDEHTIQISSEASLAAHPALCIYRLAREPEDGEQLLDQLRKQLGETYFQAGGHRGAAYFDPPSRSLLVSLPAPRQRQLAVWLVEKGWVAQK